MPTPLPSPASDSSPPPVSELLILGDGRVLGHNLTPEFTALLAALSPADPQWHGRQAATGTCPQPEQPAATATRT